MESKFSDKGKLAKRQGRKAESLRRLSCYDRLAAILFMAAFVFAAASEKGGFYSEDKRYCNLLLN